MRGPAHRNARRQVAIRRRSNLHPWRAAASSRLPPSIDPCTIESRRKFRIAGALRHLGFFGFIGDRISRRTRGRRRVDSNRKLSRHPRPFDPGHPLTGLEGVFHRPDRRQHGRAALRCWERDYALGFAPFENEMWSQRRRSYRRSGEMWSCAAEARKGVQHELNTEPWREAAQEMMVGPSGSAFRSRSQTSPSCCGQKPWW